MTTFIGLDLAWTPRNESGICVIEEDGGEFVVRRLGCATLSPAEFADMAVSVGDDVVLGIDAPLVVGPARRAEGELGRMFGRYRASAYAARVPFLTRMNGLAGPMLGAELATRGFGLDPEALRSQGVRPVRVALEVFPHAAHVGFFAIAERLSYKKGPLAERRVGLAELQRLLIEWMADEGFAAVALDPLVRGVLRADTSALGGRGLKHLEDQLDALTCALTVIDCWRSRAFLVFGDPAEGCIVAPRMPRLALPTSARVRSSP